jgi:DNA mismatch repair protein MutL
VDGLAARLFQLFGAKLLEDVVPVEGGTEWATVRGFVSRPDRPRPARPNLRLFVNGRAVRDRALSKAVLEAYRSAGGSDRGFEAFLFVEVPPHVVDVNVHPAKTEVKFADARTVWTAVERAVRAALSEGVREAPRAATGGGVAARAGAAVTAFLEHAGREPRARPLWERPGSGASLSAEGGGPASPLEAPAPLVLGQHRLVYIVASDGDELLVVDQHTAHERVRFERLLDRASRHAVESQGLLEPLVVSLAPDLLPVLDAHGEALRELGYDVEPFGGGATRVRAVPAILGTRDPGPALERLLRDLKEREAADWAVAGTRDRLAATLACHSAVRAGQPLNVEQMASIVRDVFRTAHPTLCPHGRPTVVRVPREELSRWFGRTGWRRQ